LKSLKIAYFSYARLPSRSANSIHVMRMCNAFAGHGHKVSLYVPSFPAQEYEQVNINVFRFYGVPQSFRIRRFPWLPVKGRATFYSLMATIHAKIKGHQLVYARDLKSAAMCAQLGMPVIFEAHAPVKQADEALFRKLVGSPRFIRLVVISGVLKRMYEEAWSEVSGKIRVAHDAADIGHLPEPVQSGVEVRLRVGYVGHLYQGRGIDLIIALASRCPWADFEIVGGMEADVDYWKSQPDLPDNLHFHGHLPYNDAAKIRESCQVLLAPFARELAVFGGGADTSKWMSPMKIFEYMAAGRAIICSDLPVLREVLTDDENALLCEPENLDHWQKALETLRDDSTLAQRLGSKAFADLQSRHTWSNRASSVLSDIEF
jgi:glycosyltransferase involved in cell wall biosynthesis